MRAHRVAALGEQQVGAGRALAEEHQHGARPRLLVLGRHEPGQVVDGDRAGGLLDRPQPVGKVGASQVDSEVLADQVDDLVRRVDATELARRRSCPSASTKYIVGRPGIFGELVDALQVAARVGQRRVGDPALPRPPRGRCRGTGPGSRCRAPAPGRRSASSKACSAGISLRHGRAAGLPEAEHHRPLAAWTRSTLVPPPRQGSVTSGSAPPPGPGTQSSMPISALSATQVGGVDLDLGRARARARTGSRRRRSRPAPPRAAQRPAARPVTCAHARPSVRSSLAAVSGSVGPAPYDGHQRATGQAPQAGFWAWQQRRPCQIRWWLSITQSFLGNSAPTACSALTGSVSVGPAEPAREPAEVGVDGDAGDAERVAEHDVGGLAARRRAARPGP